jgi:hypothetical protein
MLAWLVVLVLSVLSRIAHSTLGIPVEATIAIVTLTATTAICAVVVWILVRPNVIRARALGSMFTGGLVITVRRTRELMDAIAIVDPDASQAVSEADLGLWLTVVVTEDELSIWAGKTAPVRLGTIPTRAIISVVSSTQDDSALFTSLPFSAIALTVRIHDTVLDLPLIPSSDVLGGAYPPRPGRVRTLAKELDQLVAEASGNG